MERIWKMQASNAIRMFIWKAYQDALPTFSNLYKRKVVEEMDCPICKLTSITAARVLWDCEAARDVWSQGCIKIQKIVGYKSSFIEIWSHMIKNLKKEELAKVVVIAILIWFRRNNLIHGKTFTPPSSIIQAEKVEPQCFKQAMNRQQKNQTKEVVQFICSWKKPLEGIYKLNWDAAIDHTTARIGIDSIIRDSSGNVIGTL